MTAEAGAPAPADGKSGLAPGVLARRDGRGAAEYIVIPLLALLVALVAFGLFVALFGKNPLDLYGSCTRARSAPGSRGRTR